MLAEPLVDSKEPASPARILISEPAEDVRALLEIGVRRLGYEPIVYDLQSGGRIPAVDVLLAEPSSAAARKLARRLSRSGVPVVCVSIYPREQVIGDFPVAAYLVKPIGLRKLGEALTRALSPAG
jgi:hypothetical protein